MLQQSTKKSWDGSKLGWMEARKCVCVGRAFFRIFARASKGVRALLLLLLTRNGTSALVLLTSSRLTRAAAATFDTVNTARSIPDGYCIRPISCKLIPLGVCMSLLAIIISSYGTSASRGLVYGRTDNERCPRCFAAMCHHKDRCSSAPEDAVLVVSGALVAKDGNQMHHVKVFNPAWRALRLRPILQTGTTGKARQLEGKKRTKKKIKKSRHRDRDRHCRVSRWQCP